MSKESGATRYFLLLTFAVCLQTPAHAQEADEPLNIVTVAGTAFSGDGGLATAAHLGLP